MSYIIKTNKGFIKRTSNFGPFYGSIVLTQDRTEALKFSRENDALIRADVAAWRTGTDGYEHDLKKFGGPLTATVEEY